MVQVIFKFYIYFINQFFYIFSCFLTFFWKNLLSISKFINKNINFSTPEQFLSISRWFSYDRLIFDWFWCWTDFWWMFDWCLIDVWLMFDWIFWMIFDFWMIFEWFLNDFWMIFDWFLFQIDFWLISDWFLIDFWIWLILCWDCEGD